MISTYQNILDSVNKLNSICDGNAQIQKVYSSAYYISLQLRLPGKTEYVFVGRGHGNEGLLIGEKQVPSVLRKKDRFLEYLRRHIAGGRVTSFVMDDLDRAFCIEFQKWGRINKLYLHYSGRDLYFQTKIWDENKGVFNFFKSWVGKVEAVEIDFSSFDEIGRKDIKDKTSRAKLLSVQKYLNKELEQANLKGSSSKSKKFLLRKKKNIIKDLERVLGYKALLEKVDEIKFDELDSKVTLEGVKFKFKTSGFYQRKDEFFQKIKKLKKAEEILNLRLKNTDAEISISSKELVKEDNKIRVVEPIWKVQKINKVQEVISDYKIVESHGVILAYGLSSNGNEQVRSLYAKKDDWWFHLSDRPSTHVIMKAKATLDEDDFIAVGELFCKLEKLTEVDLVYTKVKNLKSIKGKAGLVKYKKERYRRYKSLNLG